VGYFHFSILLKLFSFICSFIEKKLLFFQVCTLLRKLANTGKIVVCVIHQPSSDTFNLFTHLCLLAKGRMAYLGMFGCGEGGREGEREGGNAAPRPSGKGGRKGGSAAPQGQRVSYTLAH